ncbi:Lanthionine synthetase C-like protein [Streptomyces sp. DvalAA-14]|uniref:lanthionine synthetase C family protein n=1 Tax=unclassified Streptomyces TaxID=2593676 RepID=UPI00081B8D63|nr:lanthionine synthetase C family protein [Streptomyces sp. DvalAA-14]SCD55619.1 Lanthionine synthetase C-like protein [Streptomyces sp. DvalAA-14]
MISRTGGAPFASKEADPFETTAEAQSLATGAAGTALLPIERAQRGTDSWAEVHTRLAACTSDLVADEQASLYFGAPAVAFALHTAHVSTGRYVGALDTLDAQITQLTRRRLASADARIDRGERPRVGEFDLFYGLTGLGAYLLCRDPQTKVLRDVLSYLVRLTWPLSGDDDQLPGWWTLLSPSGSISAEFPGGHGNLGMAHGIAGVLSVLAIATRRGAVVEGQTGAMRRICAWLDTWRQESDTGPWWPYWITLAEHRTGILTQAGPSRPSWCYGTPGLVRAQQLAGMALGDSDRQRMAEEALLACLADPGQLGRIRDGGICHGAAGLLHTTRRVARDARSDAFAAHLPRLQALLASQPVAGGDGFLDGTTGPALVLTSADGTTASGWDTCLLTG